MKNKEMSLAELEKVSIKCRNISIIMIIFSNVHVSLTLATYLSNNNDSMESCSCSLPAV